MVDVVRDKRGAILVQVALMLPILVIVLVGAFELWKIVYIKQTLNEAAYQGVRMLSIHPNLPATSGEVKAMVKRYASTNSLVKASLARDPNRLGVNIVPDRSGAGPCDACRCGSTAAVQVTLQWYVGEELGGRPATGSFSFLNLEGILSGSAQGVILCEQITDVQPRPGPYCP